MGFTLRSDDGTQAVMDVGRVGHGDLQAGAGLVVRRAAAGGQADAPVTAVIESFGFVIDKWDAKNVEAELTKRGLTPVADNDGKGFESFHVKDPDGFDLQISNGNGTFEAPEDAVDRKAVGAAPVCVDRLEDRLARSLLVQRRRLQEERVVLPEPARLDSRPTTRAARMN